MMYSVDTSVAPKGLLAWAASVLCAGVAFADFTSSDSAILSDIRFYARHAYEVAQNMQRENASFYGLSGQPDGSYSLDGDNVRMQIDKLFYGLNTAGAYSPSPGIPAGDQRAFLTLYGLVHGWSATNDWWGNTPSIQPYSHGLLGYVGDTYAGVTNIESMLDDALFVEYATNDVGQAYATQTQSLTEVVADIRDYLVSSPNYANVITNLAGMIAFPLSMTNSYSSQATAITNVLGASYVDFIKNYDLTPVYGQFFLNGVTPDTYDLSTLDAEWDDTFGDLMAEQDPAIWNDITRMYSKIPSETGMQGAVKNFNKFRFQAYNTFYLYQLMKKRWFSSDGSGIDVQDLKYEVDSINTNDLRQFGLNEVRADLDLGDSINPLKDDTYDAQIDEVEDMTDLDSVDNNVQSVLEDIRDEFDDWFYELPSEVEGYGLQLQVSSPKWDGEEISSPIYVDFAIPQSSRSKITSFWNLMEQLIHFSFYVWAAFRLWDLLMDRNGNTYTGIMD